MTYVVVAGRVLLAVVFAASAAGKLRPAGFRDFRDTVADWTRGRVPVTPLAAGVVVAEAATPVLLAAAPAAGLALAAVLLAGFTVAMALRLRRGTPTHCRCFGATDVPVSTRHLVRNAVLLAVVGAAVVAATATGGTGGWDAGWDGSRAAGSAVAAALAACLAVLVIRLDDVVALFLPTGLPPRPVRTRT